MNIETKIVKKEVTEYLNFGWKQTETNRVRSGEHIIRICFSA